MSIATNVTRLLDARKIPYTIFETPAEKLGALETARFLDVSPDSVFKTIVVTRTRPHKPLLVVVPGPREVDLKLLAELYGATTKAFNQAVKRNADRFPGGQFVLAAALGEKKVTLPSEREAEALTGLQAGGISPLALINKGFQVVIDSSAQALGEIHISGGQRGLNIKLPVEALAKLTNARFVEVSR